MSVLALIRKELQEHGPALLLQAGAFLLAMWLALLQQRSNIASLSSMQILGFALVSFLPLLAVLLGERLLVREYTRGTRQFLEALPVSPQLILLVKYLLGLAILFALGAGILAIARLNAGLLDLLTARELAVLGSQLAALLFLYWSIAFCFSLTGHLRFLLYLLLFGGLYLILNLPGVDPWSFGPAALLEPGKLALERSHFPKSDLIQTVGLGIAFTAAAIGLARWREGSLSDRMARALNPRDFALLAGLAILFVTLLGMLHETPTVAAPFDGGDMNVVERDDVIEVFHEPGMAARAASLADAVMSDHRLGAEALDIHLATPIQLVEDATLPWPQFKLEHDPNLLLHINFADANSAARLAIIRAVLLHEQISLHDRNRSVFEPFHWILDGWIRWWLQSQMPERERIDAELIGRAVLVAQQSDPNDFDLARNWQPIADRFGYPGAEALAYSAMRYLAVSQGDEVAMTLGRTTLAERPGHPLKVTLSYLREDAAERFQRITGLSQTTFMQDWRAWLINQVTRPEVQRTLQAIPIRTLTLDFDGSEASGYELVAQWELEAPMPDSAQCVVRQTGISLFDNEMGDHYDVEDTVDCSQGEARLPLRYGSGQRLFAVFEYVSDDFAQPIRLGRLRRAPGS